MSADAHGRLTAVGIVSVRPGTETQLARAAHRLGEEVRAWEEVAAYCDEHVLLRARAIANTARGRAADLERFVREELGAPAEPVGALYRVSDVNPEWGQDVRIVDVDGDLVLTVDHAHRSLAEAEEITRRVCAALNGEDRAAALLRDLERAADETTAPLTEDGYVGWAHALGRVQQRIRNEQILR